MKKTIIAIMAITCMISLTAISSHAGSSKRDRLEGFIIGSHAALLGAAIVGTMHHNRPVIHIQGPGERRHKKHYRSNRRHRKYERSEGHWEIKRIWVEPEYEERWNPGHYNKRGEWRSGRYQRFVVKEGYWKEKRIWVCRY